MPVTTAVPHPRVRARRVAASRARARRRLRGLLVLLSVFSLAGGGWLAVQSSWLDLDHVQVRGARRTSAAAVIRAAGVEEGEPLLLVDRRAAARRVERLPWVGEARVRVVLPGTLRIEVEERRPVAWVRTGRREQVALLDASGRVLAWQRRAPGGLPEIAWRSAVPAPGAWVRGAEAPVRIVAGAPPRLRSRLESIRREGPGFVLQMEGVERVEFGTATEVEAKWTALEAVLERVGSMPVYQIDVRAPAAPALRRTRPAPPSPSPAAGLTTEASTAEGTDEAPGH